MDQYLRHLEWIDRERNYLITTLQSWVNINSSTDSLTGLQEMMGTLKEAFGTLGCEMEEIPLRPRMSLQKNGSFIETPLGNMLALSRHLNAPKKILLCGHMDIAHAAHLLFQKSQRNGRDLITGRGSADMKSGLLIALLTLKSLENSPFAGKIGWKLLICPDEEIGSPGSREVLLKEAKKYDLGLIFEPTLPEGTLVSARKGSANYTIAVKGKAAHAGRDFSSGLNALTCAARFALAAEGLTRLSEDITVNIGYFEGGGPVNIVPDAALCRMNIRMRTKEDFKLVKEKIAQFAQNENNREGLVLTVHQDSERVPKVFDKKTRDLFDELKKCGASLGIKISWKSTGGACDGNTLAEVGLPTIDTLGGIGGNLHTSEEYVSVISMIQRSKLAARFLMQIATGEIIIK